MYEGVKKIVYEPGSKLFELDEYFKTAFIKTCPPDEEERRKRIEYSCEARAILAQFGTDEALDARLRDVRTELRDPEIGYHEMITYHIYTMPRAEHIRMCRKCGYMFDYESLLKPVNLKTGKLSIPVKCPACSESSAYEK